MNTKIDDIIVKLRWDRHIGVDFLSYNKYNIKYVEVAIYENRETERG